jgi:serine/threonine-protein kinase HipA
MNLPEGALKERVLRDFAKASGHFDEFDLLTIVGRSQLGRIRYSAREEDLDDTVPFQSVDEILRARRDGGLFDYLLATFAQYSGLSGVQPKVMIRDATKLSADKVRLSSSIRAATHIVKLWDPREYPELAANEFFCLMAARKAGLEVPPVALSDGGDALVVERFDLDGDGYLGLEDFCVLNGLTSSRKYEGGYETKLFKRLRDYIPPPRTIDPIRSLFRLFVLNCAVRNGDAHLKNFALVYKNVLDVPRLAPVFDVLSTTAYLPNDVMALTLDGSQRWPDPKRLIRLGQTRTELGMKEIEEIFEQTADALNDTRPEVKRYFRRSSSPAVGERLLSAWDAGIASSLGLSKRPVQSFMSGKHREKPLAKSHAALVQYLENEGGSYTGSLSALSRLSGLPYSTLYAALAALTASHRIKREGKTVSLIGWHSSPTI